MTILAVVTQLLERCAQVTFHAVVDDQRGVLTLDDFQHLTAVDGLYRLTLLGLAEAGFHHLSNILLLHVVLVELLDASHLVVVKPVGCLLLSQFVEDLGIELVERLSADADCSSLP